MYTCFVIDDEFAALQLIADYIKDHQDFKLLKSYNDPLLALKEIVKIHQPVDVIFLDIEMPGIDGIDFANLIRHKTKKLIFTTAHSKYAFNSYELEADAFLLKPFTFSKFSEILRKVFSIPVKENPAPQNKDFIMLKSTEQKNKLIRIKVKDIVAVEAQNKHIKVYLTNEAILAASTLTEMFKILQGYQNFTQVHRSFLISENHIKGIDRAQVLLSNNIKIPIGRTYKEIYSRVFDGN
ncbi:LytTR family DNA-binding domain-containing protein [Pedobacter nototheniae]|uniref:LytR/AlgR family response regulator transcription factor n=1 Tax=Pedobacter nototheniae TaxID=2488994 RepID=UPI00292DC2DD|nr:LytTR family DNA-binding domain-containing protein [Pedobacter nototheniae]